MIASFLLVSTNAQSSMLEVEGDVAITDLVMHMEEGAKCCGASLQLNQFTLKLPLLIMEVIMTLILSVHDHISGYHLSHGLGAPCFSRVPNIAHRDLSTPQMPTPSPLYKSLGVRQTSHFFSSSATWMVFTSVNQL
jgi:hypothetical protein